jgi:hypothetical protein
MSTRVLFAGLVLLCPVVARAGDVDRLSAWDARAYRAIVPKQSETKWKQIPWLLDLDKAIKAARKEKRPLLLWVSGDDPLERC